MGIILILVAVVVIGFVLAIKQEGVSDFLFTLGALGLIVGGFILSICIICLCMNPLDYAEDIREYNVDKESYIETLYDVDVTGYERVEAIKLMLSYNHKINKHKNRVNNFWVNWFYSKKVSELELFDISRIKKSNIDLSKKELNEF